MRKAKEPSGVSGVYASLITPRRGQEIEPDTAVLLEYLDRVVSARIAGAGVDGILLFGSTGEFIHYDSSDRMRALSLACKRSRVPVLVNISHSTIDGAVALASHAIDAGASGLLVTPPYFYRYTDEDVERFFIDLVEAVGEQTPLYIHNDELSNNPISGHLADTLLSTGHFAGFIRPDGKLTARQHDTADGLISSMAAALPELPVALYRARKGCHQSTVAALERRANDLLIWLAKFPQPVGLKHLAEIRGWIPKQVNAATDLLRHESELCAFRQFVTEWVPQTLAECGGKENFDPRGI